MYMSSQTPIPGMNYVTDAKNKRLAVIIDLEQHAELWEDFYDALTAQQREAEESLGLDEVKSMLKQG
jgi:hypothetical protein